MILNILQSRKKVWNISLIFWGLFSLIIQLHERWLFGKITCEENPTAKKRHRQARFVLARGHLFECSDKLTRLYSMSVYCLEYRQAPVESRYGVPSMAEGNPSSTYWMQTRSSVSVHTCPGNQNASIC